MAQAEMRSIPTYLGTGLALLVLLGVNLWVSTLPLGFWVLVPLLAVASAQAALVVWFLMSLPLAGRASVIFAGSGVFMLIVACLTLTDYFTRTNPLELDPGRSELRSAP